MRQAILTLLMIAVGLSSVQAKNGYKIKVKFTDEKDKMVSLAHYYGKPLPTIYKVDSAKLDNNGVAILETDDEVIGGLYLLIVAGNKKYFEFLLDNGDELNITATAEKLPLGVSFKNSPENTSFISYVSFLSDIGRQHQELNQKLAKAKTKADTVAMENDYKDLGAKVSAYRTDYIDKHPNTMLGNILQSLEMPDFPGSEKTGKERDEQWYLNYKQHYWDNVTFGDDRLVYTPVLGGKLEDYFSNYVAPIPDTFNMEADKVVEKARASKEVFKYVVHWLTTYAQESEIMGMDAVFVHMVERYYMRGEAFWLNQGTLQKYIDRAKSIAPNVIGNIAPEIKAKKRGGGDFSLHGVDAKYTLLVFWSPDCGHCREEIPRIDSLIKAEKLDKKGLKVVGFNIDKETAKWDEVLQEKGLDNWIHIHDPEGASDFRSQYDVYGTPSVYLLDKKKIIQGKKLDHTNILTVIDILEEQEKKKTN